MHLLLQVAQQAMATRLVGPRRSSAGLVRHARLLQQSSNWDWLCACCSPRALAC